MIQKIKQWLKRPKVISGYTEEQLEKVYRLGYTDGRRDGLSIAREQATKSLKEILWQQQKDERQQ